MNDLGLTLAWLAVQVGLVLLPALGLQALACRRGPAPGAWLATFSLGLAVILGLIALVPRPVREADGRKVPTSSASADPSPEPRKAGASDPTGPSDVADRPDPTAGRGRLSEGWRLTWARLGGRVSPEARLRPWGRTLAVVALIGSGVGLARLLLGLWAVGLCRRRGRRVDDPSMTALVDELRGSMGCRPAVDLREVPDLATPATAGWRRPMLLLPDDWRSWDETERRAVIAHELAHVIRGDYASGLLARAAVVMHCYHPLVRRMAARLHLQQELAADALGAQFAGGRTGYLVALSRLALKQDGRSPSWPARAFLPAPGTLIRRIEMLRDGRTMEDARRSWSKAGRLVMAFGLIALTIGVAALEGPARAADETPSPVEPAGPKAKADGAREGVVPFDVRYIPERMSGVVAFRPSAILRRPGMDSLRSLIHKEVFDEIDLPSVAKQLGVDMARPGFLELDAEDVESVVVGISFGRQGKSPQAPKGQDKPLHTIEFSGLTIRTVAPFDWPAFLRQWKMELEEIKVRRGACYRIKGPMMEALMPNIVYLPDDRTLVCDDEKWLRDVIGRDASSVPAYLRGADWERVSRDVVAVAIRNEDDAFAKEYDLGGPDDAMVLPLFKGINRWVVGVEDAESIVLRAEVTGRDPESAGSVARSIESLAKLGLAALDGLMAPEEDLPETGAQALAFRMYRGFLSGLKPVQDGPSLTLRIGDIGTFAALAEIIRSEAGESKSNPKARAAGADPKAEKR